MVWLKGSAMISRRHFALSSLVALYWPSVARADAPLVLPIDLSGSHPTVRITLAGQEPETWVFDTGAGGSVINIDRARALQLPEQEEVQVGSPAGGEPVRGFRTTITGARIGEAELPEFRAAAIPSMHSGARHTGVLSPYIFAGRLVTFDLARGEVRIADRSAAPASPPTPYSASHPLPAISVTIGTQTFEAHLDSGGPHGLALPYALAASLPLAAPPEQVGVARFVDGEHPRYRAQIVGAVQVGPLTLNDPEISMIDGLPFVNVGTPLLRRMTITLDPERRVSWATANS
jgi:hypothetical protein